MMGRKSLFSILAALIVWISAPSYALSFNQVIVGSIDFDRLLGKPLMLMRNQQSWFVVSTIPELPKGAQYYSINCTGDSCMAIVRYRENNDSNFTRSLILSSKDNGVTWSIPNFAGSEALRSIYLEASQCFENTCVVVGDGWIDKPKLTHVPLVLVSDDRGQTFSMQSIQESERGNYETIKKIDNTLIIAGWGTSPFFLISKDKGHTWNKSTVLGVPESESDKPIDDMSCASDYCAAIGFTPALRGEHLMVLVTYDQGQSWSYKHIANLPSDLNLKNHPSISCTDKTCVAGGTYTNGDYFSPWIIVSRDKGETWTYVKNIAGLTYEESPRIQEVKCYKNTCIAVGSWDKYHPYKPYQPLILLSLDGGYSWSVNSEIFNLPNTISYSILNSVSCQDKFCSAAGSANYYDKDAQQSLLLNSNDGGLTWKVAGITGLPDNVTFVHLTAINN